MFKRHARATTTMEMAFVLQAYKEMPMREETPRVFNLPPAYETSVRRERRRGKKRARMRRVGRRS